MGKNDDPSLLELFCKLKYGNKAIRRGCLLSYSQAEPEKELTQPSKHLLAEPCTKSIRHKPGVKLLRTSSTAFHHQNPAGRRVGLVLLLLCLLFQLGLYPHDQPLVTVHLGSYRTMEMRFTVFLSSRCERMRMHLHVG